MPVLILILLVAILWQLRQRAKLFRHQLTEEQVLELAQKLENLELAEPAAATWQQYLEMTNRMLKKRLNSVSHRHHPAAADSMRKQSPASPLAALCKVDLLEMKLPGAHKNAREPGLVNGRRRDLEQRTDLARMAPPKPRTAKPWRNGTWKITRADWERALQVSRGLARHAGRCLNPASCKTQKQCWKDCVIQPSLRNSSSSLFCASCSIAKHARENCRKNRNSSPS